MKWHLSNNDRNSTHVPLPKTASNWLKQICVFPCGTTNQKHYPDLGSVTDGGFTDGGFTRCCYLFGHVTCQNLPWEGLIVGRMVCHYPDLGSDTPSYHFAGKPVVVS